MAQGRSGSSMLGEVFRQNKDVLYWYEPCRAYRLPLSVTPECPGLARRLTRCEFTLEDTALLAVDPAALKRGSPVLAQMASHEVPGGDQLARVHNATMKTCTQSRAAVVKTIRLFEGLGAGYDASGPLVLHLVRDPRAVVRSERKVFDATGSASADAEDVEKAYALGLKVCTTYRRQLDSSANLDDSRHLRVRYEDIATCPELAVELIYSWSTLLPVPSSVSNWLETNTKLPDCGNATSTTTGPSGRTDGGHRRLNNNTSLENLAQFAAASKMFQACLGGARRALHARDSRELATGVPNANGTNGDGGVAITVEAETAQAEVDECHSNTMQSKLHPYGTQRHSAAMVGLWRNQMPTEEADAVLEACGESGVIAALGYTP